MNVICRVIFHVGSAPLLVSERPCRPLVLQDDLNIITESVREGIYLLIACLSSLIGRGNLLMRMRFSQSIVGRREFMWFESGRPVAVFFYFLLFTFTIQYRIPLLNWYFIVYVFIIST